MLRRPRTYYAAIVGLNAVHETDAWEEAVLVLERGLGSEQVTSVDGEVYRTQTGTVALLEFSCEINDIAEMEMIAIENGVTNIEFAARRSTALGFLEKYSN